MAITQEIKEIAAQQLAPNGTLRAAVNMSNFLLITGTDDNGEPDGVSPAMAHAVADELGVRLSISCYEGPGLIADAASSNQWDIANIAAEPARAEVISFSPAYCEIQATYLLPPNSPILSLAEVDKAGNRIAVKERSAYDLWLTDNLKNATLLRAPSLDDSFTLFCEQDLEALAGLRPKLLEQQALMPGSTLFDESFTAVQQCIGCQPGKPEAASFLAQFVQRAKHGGLVAGLIDRYGVQGRLSVAS